MAKIFISLPVLGKPDLNHVMSLNEAILSSGGRHQVLLQYNLNDSLISRVRNAHISLFINETNCDYFMSIDSDIEIINKYPTNNIFDKLIEHDLDFVGGLYALKRDTEVKSSSILRGGKMDVPFDSGLHEARWLSSGCWCVKREAVQKMVDSYPELHYDGDDNMAKKKLYGLYIPYLYAVSPEEVEGLDKPFRKYLSEDWSFCQRWLDLDPENKIWADSSIALRHWGVCAYDLWKVQAVQTPQETPPNLDFSQTPSDDDEIDKK